MTGSSPMVEIPIWKGFRKRFRRHPERFTPMADIPEDGVYQDWAKRHNGKGRRGFVKEFLDRYGGVM